MDRLKQLAHFDVVFCCDLEQVLFGARTDHLLRRKNVLHNPVDHVIEDVSVFNSRHICLFKRVHANRAEKTVQGGSDLLPDADSDRLRRLGQDLEQGFQNDLTVLLESSLGKLVDQNLEGDVHSQVPGELVNDSVADLLDQKLYDLQVVKSIGLIRVQLIQQSDHCLDSEAGSFAVLATRDVLFIGD